ncbi:MAG: oxygenase MpaB family protein [Isosphaeraceae bacterium]
MARSAVLDEIRTLDAEGEHQRIVFLSTTHDFSFDMTRSLEFALYRTYCVPSISALLDRTGEFAKRPQKRYDDTDIIVSELMEYGYDSERGRAALRKMNGMHNRFDLDNGDFLYVLSTFIYEPIRWIDRFGWRRMIEAERLALFHFWRQVGRRMNIREIPGEFDEFERFNRDYERNHFRFQESNRKIGEATRDLFLSWFPGFVRPIARPVIYALMDDPLIEAFGFPHPSSALRGMVAGLMQARAAGLRFMPARRRPRLRTEMRHRTYPEGYSIDRLGPPDRAPGGS